MTVATQSPFDPGWPRQRQLILAAARGATVVWDFDGVIADTEPLHAQSYRVLLCRRGYEPAADFFSHLIGHTERQIWGLIRQSGFAKLGDEKDLIVERRSVFLELAMASLTPSWLTLDLLPDLGKQARRQVLLSNGDPESIGRLLEAWQIASYLEWPMPSSGVGSISPPPTEGKADLLGKILAAGPAVVIEDNAEYLRQARRAGCFCVAVRHGMSPVQGIRGDVEVEI